MLVFLKTRHQRTPMVSFPGPHVFLPGLYINASRSPGLDHHIYVNFCIYLDCFDLPFQTLLKAMDVFIPQEYVMRRRAERKAAAGGAGKVSAEMVSAESGRSSVEEEKKLARPPPTFSLENEFLVSTGLTENVVFTCFSA